MDFTVDGINDLIKKGPLFALVLFRVGGLFFVAPVLSYRTFPIRIKIALSFFLALIIFPTVRFLPIDVPDNFLAFGIMVFREVAVGAVIGFLAAMLFVVFSFAGTIAGRQMAMEMASTLSPNAETGGSVTALLFYLAGAMVFLGVNGHHWLIKTVAFSYKVIPLSGFRFAPRLTDRIIESFAAYFALGVKMAAPFIIIALIVLVVVGVILKVTQQHGLFVLELPMKSLVGFFLLIVSAPFIVALMRIVLESLQNDVINLLRYMR